MNLNQYHSLIDELVSYIDDQIAEHDLDVMVEQNGNVCTLLVEKDQIVITRQEAKLELWFAARVPGAYHFIYKDGKWLSTTEQLDFFHYLNLAFKHFELEPIFKD